MIATHIAQIIGAHFHLELAVPLRRRRVLHNGRGIDQALVRFVGLRIGAAQSLEGHIGAGRLVGRKTFSGRLPLRLLLLATLAIARIQRQPSSADNLQVEAKLIPSGGCSGHRLWHSNGRGAQRTLEHVQQICGASQRLLLLIVFHIEATQLLQLCYLGFAANGQQHLQLAQLLLGLGMENGRPAINRNYRQLNEGRDEKVR